LRASFGDVQGRQFVRGKRCRVAADLLRADHEFRLRSLRLSLTFRPTRRRTCTPRSRIPACPRAPRRPATPERGVRWPVRDPDARAGDCPRTA
jgi:hypothetical protein